MRKLTLLLFILGIIAISSCNDAQNKGDEKVFITEVDDGMYLIKERFKDSTKIATDDPVVVFSEMFLEENTDEKGLYLAIDTSDFVLLDLIDYPEKQVQGNGKSMLHLTLSSSASKQLAQFTEKNLNKHVAIIVGGKAVSIHKIKSKIDGGKLQITRCSESGCEYLFYELNDNIQRRHWNKSH